MAALCPSAVLHGSGSPGSCAKTSDLPERKLDATQEMRRVHSIARWRSGLRLPGSGRPGRRMRSNYGRGTVNANVLIRKLGRNRLQESFLSHGAAQCGACTPGMLVAATALLEQNSSPRESDVMDAIGGVLCRCTGYRKIITAILDTSRLDASRNGAREQAIGPKAGAAVGNRLARLDGKRKIDGSEIFGADETPAGTLAVRAIRSPYHRARFRFGDLEAFVRDRPGIDAVFTAKDVPGRNCYGVIAKFADQPAFAEEIARHRGEAVAAVVGEAAVVESLDIADFPVRWEELPALQTIEAALAPGARSSTRIAPTIFWCGDE